MNRYILLTICVLGSVGIILGIVGLSKISQTKNTSQVSSSVVPTREAVEIPIQNNSTDKSTPTVEGYKSPEFIFDLTEEKYSKILNASTKELEKLTTAQIVHSVYADEKIDAYVSVDNSTKKLKIQPKDLLKYKPGLYKLSLKLRTLEGEVDIEQDFTWGVIAVNSKKSIYHPGETAEIGIGVLNNNGETLCLTGFKFVKKIEMVITDPNGKQTNFSTENKSIKDSGECGPTTVTNKADFQSTYKTSIPGIYQMKVIATVKNEKREITDYFKVDPDIEFDVERTSFPTRIYPRSSYPTTFTVTAKNNYTGQITDTVPSFFTIEHISDGGRIETKGNFTKIIWDVNLSAGIPKTFTYFINFPWVSPEFYLLGPITIGGFKEARQWQIASDAINSTSGVVTYEDNGGAYTWYRNWSGTAFSGQSNMDTSPADSRWFKEVSSPKTGEKIVVLQDNLTPNDELFVFRWDGSSWTEDLNFALASSATDETKSFDVTYEEESGEALLVYSDGSSNQLLYRHRAGGSWSSPANAGTAYDVYKRWVRMEARFNTDEILVGYLNNNERVGAMIWDGSTDTFTSQLPDNSGTTTRDSTEQSFDIAWETSSGTPMVFWGTSANNIIYREFTSGSWQSETSLYTGFSDDVEWVTAAADPFPTSNNIALAFQVSDWDTTEETRDCELGMWNGSSGVTRPTAVTCRSDYDGRLINTRFENNSNRALWVYALSETGTTGNSLAYLTWTSGGGFTSSTTISGDTTGNIESVQLHSDLNTTSMIALTADSAGDLNYFTWDGTTWSFDSSDLHSNIQNSGENAEAYGFGFDRNIEEQAAYRWFENSGTVAVTNALTAQDTPYTLTSGNQQFRLRLLLYTPDTLSASFREYKLQYVDPGTGTCEAPSGGTPSTWTDMPTSGGEISYYNNPTPSDGNNLTVNGSLDPTYKGLTKNPQDYEEASTFTNSVSSIPADQLGMWDFSLIDNTTYDRVAQTFCFRVSRNNNVVLKILKYPQISTAALPDVIIQGGSLIQGGTRINN